MLVGHSIVLTNGQRLLNDDVLNGTIILILVTCIFSSMVTEHAAKQMVLKEQDMPEDKRGDEERILIALGNPDTMETLVNLGLLVHNPKIKQGMYGLNIVGDDKNSGHNLNAGRKLLNGPRVSPPLQMWDWSPKAVCHPTLPMALSIHSRRPPLPKSLWDCMGPTARPTNIWANWLGRCLPRCYTK